MYRFLRGGAHKRLATSIVLALLALVVLWLGLRGSPDAVARDFEECVEQLLEDLAEQLLLALRPVEFCTAMGSYLLAVGMQIARVDPSYADRVLAAWKARLPRQRGVAGRIDEPGGAEGHVAVAGREVERAHASAIARHPPQDRADEDGDKGGHGVSEHQSKNQHAHQGAGHEAHASAQKSAAYDDRRNGVELEAHVVLARELGLRERIPERPRGGADVDDVDEYYFRVLPSASGFTTLIGAPAT